MNKILIDSTILQAHFIGDSNTTNFLKTMISAATVLGISTATELDIYSKCDPENESILAELIQQLNTYPITSSIARKAGQIKRENSSLGLMEVMVASTALENGFAILTHDASLYSGINALLVIGIPASK